MKDFHLLIAEWYRQNKRELPWRSTKNAYFIWLSEIILQQTRIEQGKSYYEKFVRNYPNIQALANADEIDILNDWQGLGYYSRARNLHFSAKQVVNEFDGVFPSTYDDIIKLKGVGKYTAAAIASFAFNEQRAVVDGNVFRFLSRLFDVHTPIDSTQGQKEFQALADELILNSDPATHNQGIMEIGSLICSPQPKCSKCPMMEHCTAFIRGTIVALPVKSKKTKVRKRYFHFLVYSENNHLILEKRSTKDIWQNLYQFPLVELENDKADLPEVFKSQTFESETFKHILSHQHIFAVFHHFDSIPDDLNRDWIEVKGNEIQDYPLPRLIDRYLENTSTQW